MSAEVLRVETPGFLSTIQDLGRQGHSSQGIPVCGAMDAYALQSANMLAGAPRGAAVIEITLVGPSLTALSECRMAIAGADLGAQVDGVPLPPWHTARLPAGSRLTFRRMRDSLGTRAYMAVNGGFDVPIVLGSRSTCLAAGFGGYEGRPLRTGDVLSAFSHAAAAHIRSLNDEMTPQIESEPTVRVVPGPEYGAFSVSSRRRFFQSAYTLSRSSNRTGYRLEGPPLAFRAGRAADIATEGVLFGTIQVTADGLPLLLMADHQTTGGYARIGTVISADLPVAGQLGPGNGIRFEAITAPEAEIIAQQHEARLRLLELALG